MGRTEKSIKNIAFGMGSQFVLILLHFVTKSIIARFLGAQIVSMNGLFHEIIACLSLAELGIGSTIVYNLYKPLAENDHEKVSQLMTFFKSAYRIIAIVILVAGGIFSFFIQYVIKDITYPLWFIRTIFLLFVVSSASSYLFSYKISLLNADQNLYIFSLYNTVLSVVKSGVNIVMLIVLDKFGDEYSYIIYLTISIVMGILSNYIISCKVDKLYPYLNNSKLDSESKKKVFDNVKNIFVKELSGKITGSTDNILISVLVSTIMVAPNQFYTTLTAMFVKTINQVEDGLKSSLGNLFAVGDPEKCISVIKRLTWGYAIFAIWGCSGLFACAEPFITVWVGKEYLYADHILFIITINLFCYIVSRPIYDAMHVAGLFREGRNISILGSVVNLLVSIAFGIPFGIFGIFLGTFCTYFIQIVMKIHYVYKKVFNTSSRSYSLCMIGFSVMLLAFIMGGRFICSFIVVNNALIQFIVNGVVVSLIYFCFVIVLFRKNSNFIYYKQLVLKKIKKKG